MRKYKTYLEWMYYIKSKYYSSDEVVDIANCDIRNINVEFEELKNK